MIPLGSDTNMGLMALKIRHNFSLFCKEATFNEETSENEKNGSGKKNGERSSKRPPRQKVLKVVRKVNYEQMKLKTSVLCEVNSHRFSISTR